MNNHLIDLTVIHAINSVHPHILADNYEGEPITTLRETKANQIKRKEALVLQALGELLEMYAHVQELAIQARPNHELSLIFECSGIELEQTEEQRY